MKIKTILTIALMKLNAIMLRIINPKLQIKGHLSCHGIKIYNFGQDNKITVGKHVILRNCRFSFKGSSHCVEIGDDVNIDGVSFVFEKGPSKIKIGTGSWLGPHCTLHAYDNTNLLIGEQCVIGKDCVFRTCDSHYIYDDTGKYINSPCNINIGNHVWIGEQAMLLKGCSIPDDCIIGARSTVTSSLAICKGNIIAGTPAKVIKKNTSWKL